MREGRRKGLPGDGAATTSSWGDLGPVINLELGNEDVASCSGGVCNTPEVCGFSSTLDVLVLNVSLNTNPPSTLSTSHGPFSRGPSGLGLSWVGRWWACARRYKWYQSNPASR